MENRGTKRLETRRLILRQMKVSDAEGMFNNWASDPEVTKFLTWPPHASLEVTKKTVESWVNRYSDPAFYNWAIELKDEGVVVGNISTVRMNESVESADIGYCMGKAWWGQGIMAEALKAVIDYLFAEVGLNRVAACHKFDKAFVIFKCRTFHGLNRVAACHDKNNPNSGRVMDKAGMQVEGVLRASGKNQQGICDMVWHSILRSEWEDSVS